MWASEDESLLAAQIEAPRLYKRKTDGLWMLLLDQA